MIRKLFKRLYINFIIKDYISEKKSKKMSIFYIPEPFYRSNDSKYMNSHQNRKEALIIGKIFKKLDYQIFVQRFDKMLFFYPKRKIIFGLEPNFVKMAKKNPKAIKIYYATGAYWEHQNNIIKNRTDEFNKKNNTKLPYERLVNEHEACIVADYIIQIGSKYTISTYPPEFQKKIITLNQSCHDFYNIDINEKIQKTKKNNYIWFGSNGSILKGLDLVLDFFLRNPEYFLNIVGPIDFEFFKIYSQKIQEARNIKINGFMNMDSLEFRKIANETAFVILPSGSEGMPGTVINMMKLGVIPIVYKYAAFDEIEEYGILIKELNETGIYNAIQKSKEILENEMAKKIINCSNYALNRYNLKRFEEEFEKIINKILSDSKHE